MRLNDLDMRVEIENILDGDMYNVPVNIPLIHRVIDNERCLCFPSGSPGVIDPKCKYCDGEGYKWTECTAVGYVSQSALTISKAGDVNVREIIFPLMIDQSDTFLIYLRHVHIPPKPGDKFYQIRLKEDGSIYYLTDSRGRKILERFSRYIVEDASRIYGDNGELIFHRVVARRDLTWLKNLPLNKRY